MYLSGYWGVEPDITSTQVHENHYISVNLVDTEGQLDCRNGTFNEDNCGGPSIWVISETKPEKDTEGLLWTTLLKGDTRYVYVFDPYDIDDLDTVVKVFDGRTDFVQCDNVYILQTVLPINIEELDTDEMGGTLGKITL